MGCNCKKDEKVSFLSVGEKKNAQRTDEILEKNFGGFRNQVDKKRKIAILKRKQKL